MSPNFVLSLCHNCGEWFESQEKEFTCFACLLNGCAADPFACEVCVMHRKVESEEGRKKYLADRARRAEEKTAHELNRQFKE